MRVARKIPEEQYLLGMGRRSGMANCDWCREKGNDPETFYMWIRWIRKKSGFPIPPVPKQPTGNRQHHDIVWVDVLPEESLCVPVDDKIRSIPSPAVQTAVLSTEIEMHGATFRFSGPIDASLYEKTLLMIGGRL